MDTLTAVRSFGRPGYSPAKRTRIYANRLYLVTMQNTETDQGDGHYLVEGEYVELVTGDEARRRRDAQLNHCNAVQEYHGPAYAVYHRPYGGDRVECQLAAGRASAKTLYDRLFREREGHISRLLAEAARCRRLSTPAAACASAQASGIGTALMPDAPQWIENAKRNAETAAECERQAACQPSWDIQCRPFTA